MAEPIPVLADAHFGISKILRPYEDFETDYQGQPATTPIMVSEVLEGPGGEPLDPMAKERRDGYSPFLMRGLKVPFGARVAIWLPKMGTSPTRYNWNLYWRLRNVFDWRVARIPFHFGKTAFGVADTRPVVGGTRLFIPAADQSTIYIQDEPTPGAYAVQNIESEAVSVNALATPLYALPFVPGGARGEFQQGEMDPLTAGAAASLPEWQLHEVQAQGDEIMLGFWRATGNWDFGALGTDLFVSTLLGNTATPMLGVYVHPGAAP